MVRHRNPLIFIGSSFLIITFVGENGHIAANNLFFIRRMGAVKDKMVDKCYYEKGISVFGLGGRCILGRTS